MAVIIGLALISWALVAIIFNAPDIAVASIVICGTIWVAAGHVIAKVKK